MTFAIYQILELLLRVLMYIIILQAILSWLVAFNVISPHDPNVGAFLNGLDRLLSPIYRPIRRVLPDFGGLDFSPMVVLLLIIILKDILLPALFAPLLTPTI